MSDLTERLRAMPTDMVIEDLLTEAADRIEELEAAVAMYYRVAGPISWTSEADQ